MPSRKPATFFVEGFGTKMLESATRRFKDLFRPSERLLLVSESGAVSLMATSEFENAEGGGEVTLEGGGASFGLRLFESLRPRLFLGGCSAGGF